MTSNATKVTTLEIIEHYQQQAVTDVHRRLDHLEDLVKVVRNGLKEDEKRRLHWWNDHTQGLVWAANQVEHALNQASALTMAVDAIRAREETHDQ